MRNYLPSFSITPLSLGADSEGKQFCQYEKQTDLTYMAIFFALSTSKSKNQGRSCFSHYITLW